MSELDLLADCLKDATKERDELAAALEQLQSECPNCGLDREIPYKMPGMRHANEQYNRLADYCIENRLFKGHDGSHTDSVIRHIEQLKAALKKANGRERPAFEAGFNICPDGWLCEDGVDLEEEWQRYRCQNETDWKVVDDETAKAIDEAALASAGESGK